MEKKIEPNKANMSFLKFHTLHKLLSQLYHSCSVFITLYTSIYEKYSNLLDAEAFVRNLVFCMVQFVPEYFQTSSKSVLSKTC